MLNYTSSSSPAVKIKLVLGKCREGLRRMDGAEFFPKLPMMTRTNSLKKSLFLPSSKDLCDRLSGYEIIYIIYVEYILSKTFHFL